MLREYFPGLSYHTKILEVDYSVLRNSKNRFEVSRSTLAKWRLGQTNISPKYLFLVIFCSEICVEMGTVMSEPYGMTSAQSENGSIMPYK